MIQRILKLEKARHPDWHDEDTSRRDIESRDDFCSLLIGMNSTSKVKFRQKIFSKTVLFLDPETDKEWASLELKARTS